MRTAVGTETSESPISVSPMYTNRPKSVILDGVDGKCILAGEHDGPMAFPTPTSSATSSTSQEESSSDGGSTLAIDDVDKSSSSYSNSDAYSATNSYNGNSLYSVQLPGFGKVLALNSEKSCDVDILYEEQKKAMDVDAFVGVDTDDEEDQDFPVYTSTTAKAMESIPEGIFASSKNVYIDDIEANYIPSSLVVDSRPMDALDHPNSDPFAQRMGKKLSWRNVNMTLVRFSYLRLCRFPQNTQQYNLQCFFSADSVQKMVQRNF